MRLLGIAEEALVAAAACTGKARIAPDTTVIAIERRQIALVAQGWSPAVPVIESTFFLVARLTSNDYQKEREPNGMMIHFLVSVNFDAMNHSASGQE